MGGHEMAPQTPQPLVAPRRSRGAPRPPNRSSRPGEAVARLDPRALVAPRRSRGAPRPPHARRAPAKPWRASTPTRSSRAGEAVARLDPHTLGAPRRSRGTPRYSGSYAIQTDLMLTNSRMPYSESSRP